MPTLTYIRFLQNLLQRDLRHNQTGATAIEYSLTLALIILAYIGIASDVGQSLFQILDTTVNCMDGNCED